jgi:hypothetical protein
MRASTAPTRQRSMAKHWLLSALLAAGVALGICIASERSDRAQGVNATVRDDLDLWALERARVSALGQNAITILGTSRILYGLDLAVLKQRFPDKTPIMLAVNGAYPLAALHDLAQDASVRGIVVVDIDARGLARYYRDMQQPQVAHYRSGVGPSATIHRRLLSYWQSNAVIADPELGLIATLARTFFAAPLPNPRHATVLVDRSAYLDFAHPGINVPGMAANFAAGVRADYLAHPPPDPATWLADLADVAADIRALRARGVKLLFFCPPTAGAHLEADLAGYPRALYWDQFARQIAEANGAYALYGLDDPIVKNLNLPDGSHVNQSDRGAFASALADTLGHIY